MTIDLELLRDLFAAAALHGILSHRGPIHGDLDHVVVRAYQYADAMLAERDDSLK